MSSTAAMPKNRRRPTPSAPQDSREQSSAAPDLSTERTNKLAAFLQSTFGLGLIGSLLLFAALPPLSLWPLAWLAPVPWILLARQPELTGKRPYLKLWCAGCIFWLLAIHWLRLPHWTTHFGWLALSFYLAFYLPVFVGLSRIASRQLNISVVLAAPVIWTGLEFCRGHLLSGFTMGAISHTQVHWLSVIQIADLIGDYGVSGLIVLVAACLARLIPWRGQRAAFWPIAIAIATIGGALFYGHSRMAGEYSRPGPTVALIQGSTSAELKADDLYLQTIFQEYLDLSKQALESTPHLDLLVWPETMYRYGLYSFAPDFVAPEGWEKTPAQRTEMCLQNLRDLQNAFRMYVENKHDAPLPPPLLLGIDAACYGKGKNDFFNSAVFIDSRGEMLNRYDKMHPVMFGEYIPLAEYIPFLYQITPLTGGLTSGTKAVSQKLGTVRYSPDICYETVVPHLIRRQMLELREKSEEPDLMVNITNDGWFRGSSELDMHLACGIFRAIEMRKPLVIAAHTGLTASVDANGKVVDQLPRKQPGYLIANVTLDSRRSFYLEHGDWLSGLCLTACTGLAGFGFWGRWKNRRAKT
jgi:apolipoprotein N-acyltransferase